MLREGLIMSLLDYINENYKDKFFIYCLLENIPTLNNAGELERDSSIQSKADEISKKLRFDEYQAILVEPLSKIYNHTKWEYITAKYSYITALRQSGESVEVITANILPVLVDGEQKYFLFQKRSKESSLYAGYYSIFGGSFSPKLDNDNLYTTAIREIKEEIIGIKSSNEELLKSLESSKKLLTQETDNGNLQINFLGVEIALQDDAKGEETEGALIKVEANNIEEFIESNIDKITPLALSALAYYLK